MVGTTQQTLNMGCHNPHIQSEQQNGLDDGNVETSQQPSVRFLLPQDSSQLRPDLYMITKVGYDGQPVFFSFCKEAT